MGQKVVAKEALSNGHYTPLGPYIFYQGHRFLPVTLFLEYDSELYGFLSLISFQRVPVKDIGVTLTCTCIYAMILYTKSCMQRYPLGLGIQILV